MSIYFLRVLDSCVRSRMYFGKLIHRREEFRHIFQRLWNNVRTILRRKRTNRKIPFSKNTFSRKIVLWIIFKNHENAKQFNRKYDFYRANATDSGFSIWCNQLFEWGFFFVGYPFVCNSSFSDFLCNFNCVVLAKSKNTIYDFSHNTRDIG